MRRPSLVLGALAAALALVPGGGAKTGPPVTGTACGPAACGHVQSFSLQFAGSNSFFRHVAPAPYFVVRIDLRPDTSILGAADPIVYVPRKAIWRVTIEGSKVWLDVPRSDERALRRAIRHVRPYAAPRSWAGVLR